MTELERRLVSLGRELDYPPVPAFRHEFRRPARSRRVRPLVLGLAVLLAVAGAVLAVSPGARSAFLEILRIRGAIVERVETLPAVQAQRLDFGERVGREEAERRAGFRLLDLGGEPDAIFVRPDGLASVVYGGPAAPRLVLSQARGAIFEGFIKKAVASGTRVAYVTVDGEPGLFLDGADHFVMFLDKNGAISHERTYLAGTVLLWNRGPLLLRIEGDLTRDEALELARSVE